MTNCTQRIRGLALWRDVCRQWNIDIILDTMLSDIISIFKDSSYIIYIYIYTHTHNKAVSDTVVLHNYTIIIIIGA